MDSVTLAHRFSEQGYDVDIISFNYGQKHVKELAFASKCAREIGAEQIMVPMNFLGDLLDSSLTNPEYDVPDGHYADDNMKQTVVPNRNAIMLNVAAGVAISCGHDFIATGVHAGDHAIYPDCRPEFIDQMSQAIATGNQGFAPSGFHIAAPFIDMSKDEICALGHAIGVDYSKTWSCYKGGEKHCGTCGTCTERKEAFLLAGVEDPTEYADA
jgi:7-cyano-7-deazaguanine synthase